MDTTKVFFIGDADTPAIQIGPDKFLQVKIPTEIFQKPFIDISGLIILCEQSTDQEGRLVERKRFVGISLAQRLREAGLSCPIVFVSALSRQRLLARKNINCNIINAIGHDFHNLTEHPRQWFETLSSIESLNELELYDIQHNYCNKIGQAQMELHALRSETTNLTILHFKLKECLEKIFGLFEQAVGLKLSEFQEGFPILTEENKNTAIDFVEHACLDIMSDFAGEGTTVHQPTKTDKGWKVLYLDDEIRSDHPFVKALEARGIEVVMATTVDEALTIWETSNLYQPEIMVVISDYRLEREIEGIKVHQTKQGYHFLKEISRSGQLVKMIALSAMPRRFLFESFKHYGIQCHIYSKKDFRIDTKEHIDFLSEEIIRLGEDNWHGITNLPDTSGWKNLSKSYAYYRESPGFLMKEKHLNHIVAKCMVNPAKAQEILEHYGLKAKTSRYSFNAKDIQKDLQNFFERFTFRRLSIGLFKGSNFSLDDIFLTVKRDIKPDQVAGNRAQFFNQMGLRLSDFPFGLTEEELNWLYYDVQLGDIRPQLTVFWEVIQKIKDAAKVFLDGAPLVREGLLGKNEFIESNYNHEEIRIYITPENVPIIRSFTGFRVLISEINNTLDNIKENNLDLLTRFHHFNQALIQLLYPYREVNTRYRNISAFVITLKNKEGKRREKEYTELVEPWNLIPYSKAKDVIFDIISAFQKEEAYTPKNRDQEYLYEALKLHIKETKEVSHSADSNSYNPIILKVAQHYKAMNQAYFDRKYKLVDYDDGIKRQTNTVSDQEEAFQNLEEFSAFDPIFKFDTNSKTFTQKEKDILIHRLTRIMDQLGISEEDEEVRIHSLPSFIQLIKANGLKDKFNFPEDTTSFLGIAYFNYSLSSKLHAKKTDISRTELELIMSVVESENEAPKLSVWMF